MPSELVAAAHDQVVKGGGPTGPTSLFDDYADAGFLPALLPIIPPGATLSARSEVDPSQCGKVPGWRKADGSWTGFPDWRGSCAAASDIRRWGRWGCGIGIQTARFPAIDIDCDAPAIAEAIAGRVRATFGAPSVRTRLNSPRCLFPLRLKDGEQPIGKIRIAFTVGGSAAVHAVEILGDGQQYIAEGIHPSGTRYEWPGGSPMFWGASALPSVTGAELRDFATHLIALLEAHGATIVGSGSSGGGDGKRYKIGAAELLSKDLAELGRALNAIPNEERSYDEWFALICASKAASGGDEEFYFDFVLPWSRRYSENSDDIVRRKWDSVHDSTVGADYIYTRAREFGFRGGCEELEALPALTGDEAIEERRRAQAPIKLTDRYDLLIDRAIEGLARSEQDIYAFGNLMVQPGRTPRRIYDGTIVAAVNVAPMNVSRLMRSLARGVPFLKPIKPAGRPKKDGSEAQITWVDAQGPAEGLCKHILGQGEWPALPGLTGIVHHPVMRADGTILDVPGFDEQTGLLFISDGTEFPKVKEAPSDSDAKEALETLLKPIGYVPYVADGDEPREPGICRNEPSASRSAALAAMLSVPLRYAVPIVPVFAYTAPRPGEAKTTHSDILSQMIDGHMAPITPVSENGEEFEKQLKAALKDGEALIVLNNVTTPLGASSLLNSATLDAAEGQIRFREFGKLENVRVPGYRIFNVNGVRLILRKDMKRRTLLIRIDSGVEKPQALRYPFSPRRLAHEMRAELIYAALTIARWQHNRGRVAPPDRVFNDFEEWDKLVSGALVALGQPDPLLAQDSIEERDDENMLIDRLLATWEETFPAAVIGAKSIIDHIESGQVESEMRDVLAELAAADGAKKGTTAQWLGQWLTAHNGVVVNGRKLIGVYKKDVKAWRWQVRPSETRTGIPGMYG